MKSAVKPKRWLKTKLQNLVRHQESGNYYARIYRDGKEVWKSLRTAHFSVAEARLISLKKEQRKQPANVVDTSNAKMTFGQAANLKLARQKENIAIKKNTRRYWEEVIESLQKNWPDLAETELRKISPAMCREWAASYSQKVGATRFNGTLTALRHIFDIGIESGIVYANPACEVKRRKVKSKKLELPSRAQFAAFVAELEAGGGRDSRNCADLVQGLAFTGCRRGEASFLEWRDLNFETPEIFIKGDPEEHTKNGEIRRIPMIPQAKQLFEKLRASRPQESDNEKVFRVNECQKAMDRAAEIVGMPRITHHDLRHLFATMCIESGVDIPTVSRWLGHRDGGALAMRTYGHLRREHSLAQAQKVSFATMSLETGT